MSSLESSVYLHLPHSPQSRWVETTEELAKKVGSSEVVTRIVEDLKDESEPYRNYWYIVLL